MAGAQDYCITDVLPEGGGGSRYQINAAYADSSPADGGGVAAGGGRTPTHRSCSCSQILESRTAFRRSKPQQVRQRTSVRRSKIAAQIMYVSQRRRRVVAGPASTPLRAYLGRCRGAGSSDRQMNGLRPFRPLCEGWGGRDDVSSTRAVHGDPRAALTSEAAPPGTAAACGRCQATNGLRLKGCGRGGTSSSSAGRDAPLMCEQGDSSASSLVRGFAALSDDCERRRGEM